MRRADREVTDINDIRQILDEGEVLHIALNNGVYPYILPVNYGYELSGGRLTLFFHGASEGAKHAVIAADNHVSVEIDCGHALVPPTGGVSCTTGYSYASLIGQGTIRKAGDSEKVKYLDVLLLHYGVTPSGYAPAHLANTLVYVIDVESYTAKRR